MKKINDFLKKHKKQNIVLGCFILFFLVENFFLELTGKRFDTAVLVKYIVAYPLYILLVTVGEFKQLFKNLEQKIDNQDKKIDAFVLKSQNDIEKSNDVTAYQLEQIKNLVNEQQKQNTQHVEKTTKKIVRQEAIIEQYTKKIEDKIKKLNEQHG